MFRFFFIVLFCSIFSQQLRAETIYYSIRQFGFDGQASLTMVGPKDFKNHKTVLIMFKAKGKNYWDQEDIYLDPATYKPLFVERNFNLNYFGQGSIEEEYAPSQILITKTEGKHVTHQVINVPQDVDNIYGFIFRYRKQGSFKVGDVIDMHLPTKNLKLQLIKQTTFEINAKSYDSYYMQSEPSRYKIWFDAADPKRPLRIMGSVGLLNSVMTMTGYDEKISS